MHSTDPAQHSPEQPQGPRKLSVSHGHMDTRLQVHRRACRWLCRGLQTLPTAGEQRSQPAGVGEGGNYSCLHKKGESLITPILPPSSATKEGHQDTNKTNVSQETLPVSRTLWGHRNLSILHKPGRRSASACGTALSPDGPEAPMASVSCDQP